MRFVWLLMLLAHATIVFLPSSSAVQDSLNQPFSASFAKLSHAPCVSLYYRNGRVGCGTEDHSIQIGELKYFDGSLPETDQPYVAVLEDYLLVGQSIDTLLGATGGGSGSGLLKGILVLNSTSSADGGSGGGGGGGGNGNSYDRVLHSLDSQTPRGYGTPSQNLQYGNYYYKWNTNGEGLFLKDMYGIPMVYVKESEVSSSLREEAQSSTVDAEIVAEFNYYMGPDGIKSQDCLAWKNAATDEWSPKCLPLAGTSVWATAGTPPNHSGGGRKDQRNLANQNARSVIMIAAGMDSTSMFHDLVPGANSAASGILTILMAANLIGANVNDQTLDGLSKRIVFALFQGETYGFVGSRNFLRDLEYPGFQCNGNIVSSVPRLENKVPYACLDPLRQSLDFMKLGSVAGMIAVDQVARAVAEDVLYVHADEGNDEYGAFLASVLYASGTNYFSVALSSTESGDNGYPYPPSPLTSLLQLSGGAVGGAVLTGYDYAFSNSVPYHSLGDDPVMKAVNLKAIAAAATIVARAAIAAAYDGGDYDSDTAAAYAVNLIPELSSNDETFMELADCFFYNGECETIKQYSAVATSNERIRTGLNIGRGVSLGNPPNYYVSVYNGYLGQPFVQVGDNVYGAYDGDEFGNRQSDAVAMQPSMLEGSIHGLFDDFLGKSGAWDAGSVSCKKSSDCSGGNYCNGDGTPTCTGGGLCVCERAHYHMALDEALLAAKNMPTGFFEVDEENDAGVSAMYTEPFWSENVGVRVFRDVGPLPGFLTLAAGLALGAASLFAAFVLKVGLKKEKLY